MQQCGEIGNRWTLSETRLMLVLYSWNLDWHLYVYIILIILSCMERRCKKLWEILRAVSSKHQERQRRKAWGTQWNAARWCHRFTDCVLDTFLRGYIEQGSLCSAQCYGLPFVVRDFLCYSLRADVWYLASGLHIQRQTRCEYECDRTPGIVFSPLVKLHRCKPE